jgi:hypothetical protein
MKIPKGEHYIFVANRGTGCAWFDRINYHRANYEDFGYCEVYACDFVGLMDFLGKCRRANYCIIRGLPQGLLFLHS